MKADKRLQELKTTLLSKRNMLVKDSQKEMKKQVSGEYRDTEDKSTEEDMCAVDNMGEYGLHRLQNNRKELLDIETALKKIEEGTYGICEECEEEIPTKRLVARPSATLCVTCQEEREHEEKFTRINSIED